MHKVYLQMVMDWYISVPSTVSRGSWSYLRDPLAFMAAQAAPGDPLSSPWVSGSPNQTLAEPKFLQLLCAAFSSSAHLAEWYYVLIMGGLCHQVSAFSQ